MSMSAQSENSEMEMHEICNLTLKLCNISTETATDNAVNEVRIFAMHLFCYDWYDVTKSIYNLSHVISL